MVQDPLTYSNLFRERLRRNNTKVWLVNTGWQGGTQATGSRIKRDYSRAIIAAITSGALDSVQYNTDPVFNLSVPAVCPGGPAAMLNPRNAWADRAVYEKTAQKLLQLLTENFKKYASRVDKSVVQALSSASQQAPQKQTPPQTQPTKANAKTGIQTNTQASGEAPLEVRTVVSEVVVHDDEILTEAPAGKKVLAKKVKPPKKALRKPIHIDDDDEEAEVGDTGSLESLEEPYIDDSGNGDDNVIIPPSLFASEPGGAFRPDDDMLTAPAFEEEEDDDDDDDSEESESTLAADGGAEQDSGQTAFKGGRRRRGGRGRRRPR